MTRQPCRVPPSQSCCHTRRPSNVPGNTHEYVSMVEFEVGVVSGVIVLPDGRVDVLRRGLPKSRPLGKSVLGEPDGAAGFRTVFTP